MNHKLFEFYNEILFLIDDKPYTFQKIFVVFENIRLILLFDLMLTLLVSYTLQHNFRFCHLFQCKCFPEKKERFVFNSSSRDDDFPRKCPTMNNVPILALFMKNTEKNNNHFL